MQVLHGVLQRLQRGHEGAEGEVVADDVGCVREAGECTRSPEGVLDRRTVQVGVPEA